MEILDIAYYCLAMSEKKQTEAEEQKAIIYSTARAISAFIAPLLSKNAKAPSFETLFPKENVNSNTINTQEDVINHLKKVKERRDRIGRAKKIIR